MALDPAEWLHAAKATPLGRSRRVRHLREPRDNLVVYNSPDRWSAYCHRCHQSGTVMKAGVILGGATPVVDTLDMPTDIQPWQDWEPILVDAVVKFLHRKGVAMSLVEQYLLGYSASRRRLIFKIQDFVLGRDLTERQPAKWLHYITGKVMHWRTDSHMYVLVEDALSAIKVQAACPHLNVVCCLGTRLHLHIRLAVPLGSIVVGFFDGDAAGVSAAAELRRSFPACTVIPALAPAGMDPKDMKVLDIQTHLTEVLSG